MHIYWWKYKLLAVLTCPSPAKLELFFSTLSLYLRRTGKQHWAGSFLVLVFNNLLQQLTILCKQYELLSNVTSSRSDVNIQNRILMWANNSYHNYHIFGKIWIFALVKNISTLMSRLGSGALSFRIELLICDWPLRLMVTKKIMDIRDREFRQLARENSCCQKNFALEYYSRYVSHITNSCIFRNQISKYKEIATSTY